MIFAALLVGVAITLIPIVLLIIAFFVARNAVTRVRLQSTDYRRVLEPVEDWDWPLVVLVVAMLIAAALIGGLVIGYWLTGLPAMAAL